MPIAYYIDPDMGLEMLENDGSYVVVRFNYEEPRKTHRLKINTNSIGDYFKLENIKYYLEDFLRVPV